MPSLSALAARSVTGRKLPACIWSYFSNRRGSVALVAALSMMMMIGSAAMAMDIANLYLRQALDQRIADQSARAAAFAYNQSGSLTTAQSTASGLATANGSGTATVATSVVSAPDGDGDKAIKVVVTSVVPLSPFGDTISAAGAPTGLLSTTVSATAYAEIHLNVSPCVIALTNSGISAVGGDTLTATSCAIASNGSVTDTTGAVISGQSIYAVGSITAGSGGTIRTSPTTGQTFAGSSSTADPFASSNVFARLPTVAAMTAPSFPSVGSAPTGSGYPSCTSGTLTVAAGTHGTVTASGCTVNFTGGAETDIGGSGISISGGNVTLNFASGTYKINGIGIYSYGTTTINITGTVVLDIWNGIGLGGSASLTVNGPATYNVQGGITNGSSGSLVFTNANSTSTTSTFNVANGIVVSSGTASFPNGTYTITSGDSGTGAGIDVSGGTPVTFGNGSYIITNGINVGGGKSLTIGGALNASSVFQIPSGSTSGGLGISTGGSSTFTLGSFTNFDINGGVTLAGNASLGSGVYTINGALDAAGSGGNSITGTSVQLIASGAVSFGQGYSTIDLTAPTAITSATDGSLTTVALASKSTSASSITAGASNTIVVGAVYFPSAPLTFSGSGTLTGNGNCLQVVVTGLAFSGGTSLATNCASLGTAAAVAVTLVQ